MGGQAWAEDKFEAYVAEVEANDEKKETTEAIDSVEEAKVEEEKKEETKEA